jgi:serine/threonine protein kinase
MSACQDIGTISKFEFKQRYTKIKSVGSGENGVVYNAINKQTGHNVALKIAYDGNKQEIEPSCNYASILRWTEGIVSVYEYGLIEGKDYLFYTMPILYQLPTMTSEQELDFVFELLYTLVVLAQHGISHNDLNSDNILCKTVSYKRQYIINDRRYLISSNILPVIIDFGEISLNAPTDRFSGDTIWKLVAMEDMEYSLENIIRDENILNTLVEELRASDRFDILFHPIFDSLRQKDIQAGDVIKIFESLLLN